MPSEASEAGVAPSLQLLLQVVEIGCDRIEKLVRSRSL